MTVLDGIITLKACRANADLSAEEIAKRSVKIASNICIYTNSNIITEVI